MENITPAVAFLAGILSFLSPCVLPLVPVYIASLCGPAVFDSEGKGQTKLALFMHAVSFVLGFTIIFTGLGAIAGITGFAVNPDPLLLRRIAGSLLIVFGLFMLLALRVPWLNYERRVHLKSSHRTGYIRSFLIGAVFSLAWTPCVGPILGGILTLAWSTETAGSGAFLLAIYSLGLGVPFLIIGAAFNTMTPVLRAIQRYSRWIYVVSGLLLVIVGILTLANLLSLLATLSG